MNKAFELEVSDELGVDFFLETREMGIINIGGAGKVTLDGTVYEIASRDGLFEGMGTKDIKFEFLDSSKPAKFYINSCPC